MNSGVEPIAGEAVAQAQLEGGAIPGKRARGIELGAPVGQRDAVSQLAEDDIPQVRGGWARLHLFRVAGKRRQLAGPADRGSKSPNQGRRREGGARIFLNLVS